MTSPADVAFNLVTTLDGCQNVQNFQVHGAHWANRMATKIGQSGNPLACLYEIAYLLAEPYFYENIAFFARQFQIILMGTPWTTYDILDATRRLYGVPAQAD